jgi:FAD-dependent oxidoreductase domain-containing protein 1
MPDPLPAAGHVVIVGGGIMGAATAWHLARRHGATVTVCERDPAYARASSALSACAIRQQFSTAINIRVSQASLLVYRDLAGHLGLGDDAPALGLVEPGYLYLARTAAGAATLRDQVALQHTLGVPTALLEPDALRARFPWLATDDLTLGTLGVSTPTSGEGWFDGYAALQAYRRAGGAAGVRYVAAEVTGFDTDRAAGGRRVRAARTAGGDRLPCDAVVIAAGAWSAPVAATLDVPLPVRARKRDVFAIEAAIALPDAPLLIDPTGVWCRPEAAPGRFLCGAPPRGDDADDAPLHQVDHGLFDAVIWPALAHRVPAFDALRVHAAWAGYYEMNTVDHNGLVGALPGVANAFTACGFSGHGLQQAPAVAEALAAHLVTGGWPSLDLTPLGVERIAAGRPLLERNVI